jgi:hypothetical protein
MSTASPSAPLTVLWFGGGQDSTALLYLYAFDTSFRARYTEGTHFLVVMSDTGNEYPETYQHCQEVARFCEAQGIEFHLLTPAHGYHSSSWQSLPEQYDRSRGLMSLCFPKSCTDALKIQVCYRFLANYVRERYGFTGAGNRVFYEYAARFGPLRSLIGFAKGEEARCAAPAPELFQEYVKDARPKWMQRCVVHAYPLIPLGLDRAACQELIANYGRPVPPPSNCMMCPFQSDAELVYLYRFQPAEWARWVAYEQQKLSRDQERGTTRNLGAKGTILLPEALTKALTKFGHLTDEHLHAHKMSHGHCVKSKY